MRTPRVARGGARRRRPGRRSSPPAACRRRSATRGATWCARSARWTSTIAHGEFVCLIGPSGCGKTTLLNLFAGLDRPDTGEILDGRRPVTRPGPERAVLFQDPALFPWLSVRANVEFALELIGVPKGERGDRAMHWLRTRAPRAVRERAAARALGRDALAGRAGPRARLPAAGPARRRAVRGARRADAGDPAGRAPGGLERDAEHVRLRHAQRARGGVPRRPRRADVGAPGDRSWPSTGSPRHARASSRTCCSRRWSWTSTTTC